MNKGTQIALLAVIVAAIFSVNASAGHIGDFNHTIKINVDCSHCPTDANRKIKVRLYADGHPVPNTEVTLDNKEVKIKYDPSKTDEEKLAKAIKKLSHPTRSKRLGDYKEKL